MKQNLKGLSMSVVYDNNVLNPIRGQQAGASHRRLCCLKVSKSRKQNTKFSHTPKNQRNFVHLFALASKKWLKQKIKALDDLN